jgi:hypothetical protein
MAKPGIQMGGQGMSETFVRHDEAVLNPPGYLTEDAEEDRRGDLPLSLQATDPLRSGWGVLECET